ncbi:MAG: CPBP family intramembrane metalloprotease [Mediterranea sp.]|jgi:membrane protease YdiL (CAAX protease family)|nr:CPBP family intramembrane metalloprotease [Mediterranea sp.]
MEIENNVEKERVRRIPVWASIPVFILLWLILTTTISIPLVLFMGGMKQLELNSWGSVWAKAIEMTAGLIAAAILLYFDSRPFADLGLRLRGHLKDLGWGLAMALLIYAVGFAFSLAIGSVEIVGTHVDLSGLWMSFVLFIFVAIDEEVIVRGFILGRLLHTRLNKFLSLFISAAIFSAMHLFNPNITFLPMLNLLLAGLLLGASYLYTRNLMFPISLHLFWNWIQGPILGYEVSGNSGYDTLIELKMSAGDSLWNGGAFGFEGSLPCTVLCLLAVLLIIWWGEKQEALKLARRQSYSD